MLTFAKKSPVYIPNIFYPKLEPHFLPVPLKEDMEDKAE